jgi:hypothetical protein
MFKKVRQHMEGVEHAVNGMRANAAFAFALACTERQWPVFQRASESVPWLVEWRTILRRELDAAWKLVLRDTLLQFSDSLARFRELLLSWVAGPMEVEDTDGLSSALAQTIANSMADLLGSLQKGNVASTPFPADRNFDLLELLLDEHGILLDDLKEESGHDSAEIAAVRELIEQEMQQQNRDVQALAKDSSAAGIEEVQRTSAGKSLFGQVLA